MPAKKKAAKKRRSGAACVMCEQLAADLQRVLAERDEARKDLAEARRGREAWCRKALELELRAEHAEEQLKLLLARITSQRPSQAACPPGPHVCGRPECARHPSTARQPAPTFGLPGDAPTTRFSREFRG